MPKRPEETHPDSATLDNPEGVPAKAFVSPSLSCRPDVCQLGDRVSTWKGLHNAECPRCDFATISQEEAKKRNPRIVWPS